ncbi:MAG: hypothetical protein U5N55_05165 [Cypionkella sp.]|nr:hypothetical protein [Cypionkella sp.]
MILGLHISLAGSGRAAPSIITGASPVLAPLLVNDVLSGAVTWGSYTSTAGTIVSAVRQVSINSLAPVAYNGATVAAAGTYQVSETVTDSAGNVRVFYSTVQIVVSGWILTTGSWDDLGQWVDTAVWRDA